MNQDGRLLRQAASTYADALGLLNHNLLVGPSGDDAVACLNLVAYSFYVTLRANFDAYAAGMSAVMQQCGPDAFKTGESHLFFLASRQSLIYGAMNARRETFLATNARLGIIPIEDKSAYDKLLDIMTLFPGQRARLVEIQKLIGEREALSSATCICQASVEDQNGITRVVWRAGLGCLAIEEKFHDALGSCDHPLQEEYNFACFQDASMLCLYWACLVEVYNILGQCYDIIGVRETSCFVPITLRRSGASQLASTSSTATCGSLADPLLEQSIRPFVAAEKCKASAMLFAKHICSSVRYLTAHTSSAFCLMHIVGPLKLSMRCFVLNLPASKAHLEWTYASLIALQTTGIGIAQAILEDNGEH